MVAMFGAMAVLRRLDQEEPLVLLYTRVAYLAYFGLTALVYIILHYRIIARKDTTLIKAPISTKPPSFSDALRQAKRTAEQEMEKKKEENDYDKDEVSITSIVATETTDVDGKDKSSDGENEDDETPRNDNEKKEEYETITVMEYDLRQLASARRGWVMNSCFLAAVHYHMESVSPLIMSALMGFMRLIGEDPLVQLHLRGAPSVGKLARPFTAEKNPLASLFKDFAPKEDKPGQVQDSSSPEDDLHDDGDDDEDDEAPNGIPNLIDDHVKSDFDDDESAETKKTQ